jgi:hypothetical protein
VCGEPDNEKADQRNGEDDKENCEEHQEFFGDWCGLFVLRELNGK